MLYRATGTFNRSYIEELDVHQVPLSKWTMVVIAFITFAVIPYFANAYYISILNFIGVAALGAKPLTRMFLVAPSMASTLISPNMPILAAP